MNRAMVFGLFYLRWWNLVFAGYFEKSGCKRGGFVVKLW
jgi:hypothetical protein